MFGFRTYNTLFFNIYALSLNSYTIIEINSKTLLGVVIFMLIMLSCMFIEARLLFFSATYCIVCPYVRTTKRL